MAAQRTIVQRAIRQESEVLLRQLDTYLTALRTSRPDQDVEHAEKVAGALRRLIADTAKASAADRARVRAAVHYFVHRGGAGQRRSGGVRLALLTGGRAAAEPQRDRCDAEDDRVVNDLLRELGRPDLIVPR